MSWKGVNLEEVLVKNRARQQRRKPDEVLNAFRDLLREDDAREEAIRKALKDGSDQLDNVNVSILEADRIFTGEQIKNLCRVYRLRFLAAQRFKGEIPYEAISRVKQLQRKNSGDLTNFKILAPAAMFNLVEKDKDPLLFLSLGNDRYYLVHKWGKDMSILRKLLVFPFRSLKTLLGCVLALTFVVVMSIPDSVMISPQGGSLVSLRIIFFFYLFIAFSGLTTLYGFSRMKNFNGALWDSHYTN
ncbi:MAG TPA: hypothetical protein DCG19_05030 [Cryomorphaceae bacterium]|nr:hypothetical protein [Owenweeksia sp.]MBF98304.1 hypothetical protein [Owenweeksia sp.]HAD96747.1 hypothetical protein [Cryomorphaceae bacterium]HBF21226.1 hypothetical protein [Cryomorphaceae bacterium]HCQ16202.1 hypothetical protein [Cryomorphaceae bacterium]|tara:strand:+ start:1937 stop:2668 length:732 start_codon:yes stop_codon:yes gene_type:complete